VPTPSEDDHVANKKYVDDTLSSLNFSKMFGTGELGAVVNPSWTDIGIYDCESLEISAPVTLPWFSVIRVRGNCTISDTATVTKRPDTRAGADLNEHGISASDLSILAQLCPPLIVCNAGFCDGGTQGGGGGGSLGLLHGASSNNGTATNRLGAGGYANFNVNPGGTAVKASLDLWKTLPIVVTGHGSGWGGNLANGVGKGKAGGICILLVGGDLTMTGGVIDANGQDGVDADDAGGGAGGYVVVHVNGTMTDGTIQASGGDGANNGAADGGGGAAGVVVMRVRTATGTPVVIAEGGDAVNDRDPDAGSGSYVFRVVVGGVAISTVQTAGSSATGTDGTAGLTVTVTLTDNQFDQLSVPWLE
jgi:hypothetical protein